VICDEAPRFATTKNSYSVEHTDKDSFLRLRQMPQQDPVLNHHPHISSQSYVDLPADAVGIIMGRNKQNIFSIQKESGAKLVLDKIGRPEEIVRAQNRFALVFP
jgi:hypothetical protein